MAYEGRQRWGELFKNRREKGKPGLPMLSVTLNNGLVDRASLGRKTDTNLDDNQHLLVHKGDIVYNMMRMWQGASGLAEQDGLVSPAYVVLAPKAKIDSRYASYLFKSQRMIYLFWAYSYGLTSDRLRLYYRDFARIPTTIPSIEKQIRTAEGLSAWDRAMDATERLLANSRLQMAALMQQLLTRKGRLPGFDDAWRDVSVKEMGKIVSGGTPDTENSEFWDGDIPWATPSDLANLDTRFIETTERKITREGMKASAATPLPARSILLCSRASVGALAISKNEITTNQGFKSLILDPRFDSDFVYYIFQFRKRDFIKYACGSTFLEISKKDIEKRRFLVPRLEEQKAIAKILNAADRETRILLEMRWKFANEREALTQKLAVHQSYHAPRAE
jgi:type I restriction enzyme, S subunit